MVASKDTQAFKLNLKNIELIKGMQHSQEEIAAEVGRIKDLAEEGYKETLIAGFNTVIKNAKQILNQPQTKDHTNCHIYLIYINRLIDSIAEIESQISESSLGDSDDIVLGLRDAVRAIGAILSK